MATITTPPPGETIPMYPGGPDDYQGPTMGYLMKHNLLAGQIIRTYSLKPADILDNNGLAFLKRWVSDPSPEATQKLLAEKDLLDAPGEEKGNRANKVYGSLVGYAIATGKFSQAEIRELKEWFDSGALGSELDGIEPCGPPLTKEEYEKLNKKDG